METATIIVWTLVFVVAPWAGVGVQVWTMYRKRRGVEDPRRGFEVVRRAV